MRRRQRFSGRGRRTAALALNALWLAPSGCGRTAPAVTTNQVVAPVEQGPWRVLDEEEQARVLGALEAMAHGHRPVNPPGPAPQKARWSDVEPAAAAALDDVEAAVVETVREPGGRAVRFRIRTVEDWPGELVVRRLDDPAVYEAKAWIGHFPDMPARRERCDALLEAFDRRMAELGRTAWFNEDR